jgi:hypothetical protein
MVRFDDIHIADDYSSLVVECHVEDYAVYNNMYIKSIYLEYYKNRGTIGVPSNKAIQLYNNATPDTSVKSVRATLSVASLDAAEVGTSTFERELFYIYVTCDGTLDPSVSSMDCDMDVTLDVGVVLDWQYLYQKGMKYIAGIASCRNTCEDVDNFESYILLWNALKMAADVCDWTQLERIWPKLVAAPNGMSISGCGCKG